MALTRRRRRSTIAIKYMGLSESRLKRQEANRSGEAVTLKCGVCGQPLHNTTIRELLLKKTADRLSEVVSQSDFHLHMDKTGHADMVSDHELVVINNYFVIHKGTVGIKLNYP